MIKQMYKQHSQVSKCSVVALVGKDAGVIKNVIVHA